MSEDQKTPFFWHYGLAHRASVPADASTLPAVIYGGGGGAGSALQRFAEGSYDGEVMELRYAGGVAVSPANPMTRSTNITQSAVVVKHWSEKDQKWIAINHRRDGSGRMSMLIPEGEKHE